VAAGFSLVELVIVLGLAGLLLAFGLPNYLDYTSNQRTVAVARTLASDLHVALQEAVTRRLPIAVSFSTADDTCGSPGARSYALAQDASVIKRLCFPPDVEWAPLPWAPMVFKATGGADGPSQLVVRSTRTGRQHRVIISLETGAITDDTR
jgi:type II secretory pathway pseudopilin PulG